VYKNTQQAAGFSDDELNSFGSPTSEQLALEILSLPQGFGRDTRRLLAGFSLRRLGFDPTTGHLRFLVLQVALW
jgi:hypothetical protein